ncbi:MAG: hypothetical protein FWH16_03705, partial [Oscillospiraceae bacterium]|nr:hypothetical protein [Oscillospiraceae bacterium]
INEVKLQGTAAVAETMLNENRLTDRQMETLGAELNAVLQKYAHLLPGGTEDTVKIVDETRIGELLAELEPMLEAQNMACMDMLDTIRAVPGAEELVWNIEKLDFEQAVIALQSLKGERY